MTIRHRFPIGFASLALCGVGFAQQTVKLDIEAQPLDRALNSWATQTGYQVLIPVERAARGRESPPVKGHYTPEGALKVLLASSNLEYQFVNSRTVTIRKTGASESAKDARTSSRESSAPLALAQSRPRETKVTATEATATTAASTNRSEQTRASDGVAEVLVTAQKRSERLQEVPVPVTALSTAALASNNQTQLRDYYTRVPGLNLTDAGIYGGSVISFRGITSGILNGGTATVVVDDVPYGISSNPGGPTSVVPEIDPADLERIEALRGPQGTLYGASSMGGLLKYVTRDPDLAGRSAYFRAGGNASENGDGLGYNVSVGGNIPLGDTWALRASAFTRRDPGYIDDPVHDIDGLNWGEVKGGRLSALWEPSETASIRFGALYQESEAGGNAYSGPVVGFGTLGELQQVAAPGSGGFRKELQVYTAHVSLELGPLDLTSITAYSINEADYSFDTSSVHRAITQANFGESGGKAVSEGTTKRFTQEIRFTMPLGERVEWLFGGFYVDEDNPRINRYLALDFDTGEAVGEYGYLEFPSTFKEKAAFTDFTFHFTDRFDVQVGGRLAYNDQTLPAALSSGPLFGGSRIAPAAESEDHSFTYLLTPRFRISPNLMVYARLASGYRPGGPNLNTAADPAIPLTFDPDETQNFEIGAKGTAFDRMLSFDASVYYIRWEKVQLTSLISPRSLNYKDNGNNAKSQGVDLAVELRPIQGMTISAAGAWNVAELTEDFPANSSIRGLEGDRLPFSSRFSGSVSIDQEFPIGSAMRGFVGVSESYVGNRKGPFVGATATRADLPEYYITDVRAGVRSGPWEANLFVNNAFDERGLLMGGAGSFLPNIFSYTRPRTMGLSVSIEF